MFWNAFCQNQKSCCRVFEKIWEMKVFLFKCAPVFYSNSAQIKSLSI